MPEAPPRSDDWKMLTLVGLANRISARTSLVAKSDQPPDTHKNRQRTSAGVFKKILRMLDVGGAQADAVQRLGDLDKSRKEAIAEFIRRMPVLGKCDTWPEGVAEPASPENILKSFCLIALRVRATSPDASLSDIAWHTAKHVVAPHLATYLLILEHKHPDPKMWPMDYRSNDGGAIGDWRKPRALLESVKDGSFSRAMLDPEGPSLSLPSFKENAAKTSALDLECTKVAMLLRVLLQQCGGSDEDWKIARGLASVTLRYMASAGSQASRGLGDAMVTELSPDNMAQFCDLVSAAIISDMSRRGEFLDRKLNLPQTRRRILMFTPYISDPSTDELDMDFPGAVRMIRERLEREDNDDWARECMGYAYYMSRRCLFSEDDLKGNAETEAKEAAALTYDLMSRAFKIGDPATQQVALRYLAGFSTNPRFRCSALTQKEAPKWVKLYESSAPKGMAKLFQGRLAFIKGDTKRTRSCYTDTFLRAIPPDFVEDNYAPLEDHEALAYLLPECYALTSALLNETSPGDGKESALQVQIRRASVAHFGIECDWAKEARRIIKGFEFRRKLLA